MKWHLAVLYAGLATAIVGVVSLGTYAVEFEERQNATSRAFARLLEFEDRQAALAARISGLEERQVALTTWSVNVDRNLSGLEERQAALTRWSVGVDGESQSVASDIASLRRSVRGDSSRISAVERQLRSLGSRPTQQVVTPQNSQGLDELRAALLEWAEDVDDWRTDYAQWRRSVESRLQCAIPPSVIVDIVAVVQGDFAKVPGLIRQAQTTARCLS